VAAPNGYILSVHDRDLTPLGERQLQLPIRIGRSSLNDVPVAHGLVSEFHARVEEIDGKLCVRDLNSKNGVLVEARGADGAARIPAHLPVDLEPYGFEFSLSPLLRVRLRPAPEAALGARQSLAVGRVLGNPNGAIAAGPAFAEDKLTEVFIPQPAAFGSLARAPASVQRPPLLTPAQGFASEPPRILPRPSTTPPRELPRRTPAYVGGGPPSASAAVLPYASVFIEPTSAPLDLPAPPPSLPLLEPVPARAEPRTRLSPAPPAPRAATLLEPAARAAPQHATAWEVSPNGTLPGDASAAPDTPDAPGGISLEALALRGLRELAASLIPGQPVESAGDVIQLVTKLHDALEMFCRCFVPVREACSRFIDPDELERAAAERCQLRSPAYLAVERALEPREVASALLSFRDGAEDAPSAVEHILADLMLQQLALIEGALDGTRALLEELSPARLEAREPQPEGILSRLAGNRERALWETFRERHAQLATNRELLRQLLGPSFARAYLARGTAR